MSVRLSNAIGCCPVCKNESLMADKQFTKFWHQYRYTIISCGIDTCDYRLIKDESRKAMHEDAIRLWHANKITGDEFLKRMWA